MVSPWGYSVNLIVPDLASAGAWIEQAAGGLLLLSASLVTEKESALLNGLSGRLGLILTVNPAKAFDVTAWLGAARGFLCNDARPEDVRRCLDTVSRGESWTDPHLRGPVKRMISYDSHCLSRREVEIARLAVGGESNKRIARALQLSDGTVKAHMHHIFAKLHVGGRKSLCELVSSGATGLSSFGPAPPNPSSRSDDDTVWQSSRSN